MVVSSSMSQHPQGPTESAPGRRFRLAIMAVVIVLTITTATIWMGASMGWEAIGSGGVNAQYIPKVGDPAPELFTVDEFGKPMLLSSLKGQPVWINFWGSWCAPCRSEMPEISRAYNTLTPEGLTILSISMRESPEQAIAYRDRAGASFPVYADPAYLARFVDREKNPTVAELMDSVTSEWQINNFPTHVFIDADGIVRRVVIAQMTYDEAVGYGRELLTAPASSPVALVPDRRD